MRSLHQDAALMPLLAASLHEELHGKTFLGAWKTSKEGPLKLNFGSDGAQLLFTFNTSCKTGLFFPETYVSERPGGAQPLFRELEGQTLVSVEPHTGNRSVALNFSDNFTLVLLFYGPTSNIVLFSDDQVVSVFRNAIEAHKAMSLSGLSQEGRAFELPRPPFAIVQNSSFELPVLASKIALQSAVILESDHLFDLLAPFSLRYISTWHFIETRTQLERKYLQQKKRLQSLVKDIGLYLESAKHRITPGETANVIMANLHALTKGVSEISLFDFYRNEPVTIAMKKNLSPQDNATVYYQKEKNRKKELELKQRKLEESKAALDQTEANLLLVQQATSMAELKPLLKGESKQSDKDLSSSPFRVFTYNGYQVLVGKNASGNDQLTLKTARKDDIWLHAKGAGGSHVVLKNQPGKVLPESVIRFAASVAAYYSQLRGSAMVPVSYTQKKFVRKPKGAAPGQVIMEREEVILVEPWVPGES